ncbi:hypothetical protein [Yoonia sp. 208BN28-4]|uniref:hypothetical protein n=1 Tax=Yoonia sp. 208BN28-4 TaxID=3126505 RepID=UPI00309D0149
MTYTRMIAATLIVTGLTACSSSSNSSPPPDPSYADLLTQRNDIRALVSTSASQSDLPPGGSAEYRGAYAGVFVTARDAPAIQIAGPAVMDVAFGSSPTADLRIDRITSDTLPDLSGELVANDMAITNGQIEDSTTLMLTGVPVGGATATLESDVFIFGSFSVNANQAIGNITTGATEGFNTNGNFAVARQP